MKLNDLNIPIGAALAPMAGATDSSMRRICAELGAVMCTSEMVSAKALTMNDSKSKALMRGGANGSVYGIQLFGSVSSDMARAIELIENSGIAHDYIDINMGCPAPKITSSGAGSALLKNHVLAQQITAACVASAHCPVTVKLRLGWDNDSINALELAQRCEAAGAAAVCVHARTRAEMYTPGTHYEEVAKIKSVLSIPVILNGDVDSAAAAMQALRETQCDSVMIGRAALGNPWIFEQVSASMRGEAIPKEPTLEARLAMLRRNISDMCNEKGEKSAMQQARSHAAWYMHGLHGAAELRRECCALLHFTDIDTLIATARRLNSA